MSRLFDRVSANGCAPMRRDHYQLLALKSDPEGALASAKQFLSSAGRDDVNSTAFLRQVISEASIDVADQAITPDELEGAVVFAADDVARYLYSVSPRSLWEDVDVVAPPYQLFWIEFQGVPNPAGFNAWGLLIEADEVDRKDPEYQIILERWRSSFDALGSESAPEPAWNVRARLVVEWRKGEPVGPVSTYDFGVDAEGRVTPCAEDGTPTFWSVFAQIPNVDIDSQERWRVVLQQYLAPALLTVGFLHCKNVDVVTESPPDKLSRAWRRRHDRSLVRYKTLVIDPMRRRLETDGDLDSNGLRTAMHICRGHFKSFTEEAPLFGRYTGRYWWAPQLRGDASQGEVRKDYRLRVDAGQLGEPYVPANEHSELRDRGEGRGNPDLSGRGLAAHNQTQNQLAEAVARKGFVPRQAKPSEPQFDLAWETPACVYVAEVKSLTAINEERQLRLAMGQVLRYQQLLDAGDRPVTAVIVAETMPTDESWLDLCGAKGIVLMWPEVFDRALPS